MDIQLARKGDLEYSQQKSLDAWPRSQLDLTVFPEHTISPSCKSKQKVGIHQQTKTTFQDSTCYMHNDLGPVARKVDNSIQWIVIFSIAVERH